MLRTVLKGVKLPLVGRMFSTLPADIKHTGLYDWHIENKGNMVEFAGYALPITFEGEGIMKEHLHTRESAGLFDVSHMGNVRIFGKDRFKFLESIVVGDVEKIPNNGALLSLIMTKEGGIVDDTMITNFLDMDYLSMIVNGACKYKDWDYFNMVLQEDFKGMDVKLEHNQDNALLAIQGPKATALLQEIVPEIDITKMKFMHSIWHKIKKIESLCQITRCGYTGEDGFEIAIPNSAAHELADLILGIKESNGENIAKPVGLGARDTLRLEAGLCLYGNDLTEETSPVEGLLQWTIGANKKKVGGYRGADVVLKHIKDGVKRKRCGFVTQGKAARPGDIIYDSEEREVGIVTSGTHSPSLKTGIGMAYVDLPYNKAKTELKMKVVNKMKPVVIKKMPFVPTNYYRAPTE